VANMLPSDNHNFTTDGEKAFYRFLHACAKPDDKYIAWYQPDILGSEPDFILYAKDSGLIIFEVKDWALDQIIAADPLYFTLYMEGKEERRRNPAHQIRDYFGKVMDRIKHDGYLVSKNPNTYGQVKVTVNSGIVFPNINKYEFEQKGLHHIIPSERIFFWDDLHPQSPICADSTGLCFQKALDRILTVRPRFSITGKEFNHLRQLIFPEIRIYLPDRDTPKKRIGESRRLNLLDHHQESIARAYDGGHQIITGPSGSGKTLILVHRAAMLKRYNPVVKKILFVCYNITLVNYVKRLLSDKHVPLGEGNVEVLHFYELCGRLTGEEIPYERADTEYYELVIEDTLEKLSSCPLKYDAVLVDEGQDFSHDMLKIIMALLNPMTNHLTIALDENQNIYQRCRSWKELGIQVPGRVHRLTWIYRNTREIADFAAALIGNGTLSAVESDVTTNHKGQLFPETFESHHGAPPDIRRFQNYKEITAWMAETIRNLSSEEGYPLSDIAAIYPIKAPQNDPSMNLPYLVGKELDRKGLLHNWISEDYRAKQSYDITTESVTISTIHSAKGIDYACVFLLGIDWLVPGRWTEEQIIRMVYVASTRAREKLYIPYCSNNTVIEKIIN